MKSFASSLSANPRVLVACLSLGLSLAGGRGHADEEKAVKSPAAGDAPEEGDPEDAPEVRGLAMLPVGKTNLGVRLPVFEGAKQTMFFQAAEMTPKDKEEIAMTGVEIVILNDEGSADTRIVMSSSRYLVPLGLLSSDEKTVIHGSDYTLTGATLDFDANRKYGVMRGPVKMILRDFDKLKGGGKDGEVLDKKDKKEDRSKPEATTKPATETNHDPISPETPKP